VLEINEGWQSVLACGKLFAMKKPTLVILERIDSVPVKAGCSACKEILFSTGTVISNMQQHQKTLEQMFREHFRTVHEREAANRAAAQ
jgi:hypothetical protein